MSVRRARVVPAIVLVATLVLLAVDAWWVLGLGVQPVDVAHLRRADAERVLAYRVGPATGPRFALDGEPVVLRFATHLVLRRGAAYDPARRARYTLALEIHAGGETTWRRDLAVESRQSKGEPVGRGYRHEGAFADDPTVQLTDERLVLVRLPATAPGSELRLSARSDDGDEVLVRAFVERPRSGAERARLEAVLDPEAREALLASSTYVPWALVPVAERSARLARRGERLFAIGERDHDYLLRTIYVSSFRAREVTEATTEATEVGPGRPIALVVTGPTTLRVATVDRGVADPRVRWTRIEAGGGRGEGVARVAEGAPARIDVPPGVASITLDADVVRRLIVVAPAGGAFPPAPGLGEVRLAPLRTTANVERVGPERAALELPLWPAGTAGPIGRIVHLELRRIGVDGAPPQPPARVHLRFIDDRGKVLGEQVEEIDAPPAPFERYRDAPGQPDAPVSEPLAVIALAPARATGLRIDAEAPVAVRASRATGDADVIAEPYGAVALGAARWRRAPLASHRFLAFTSLGGRELDRRPSVSGQTRLELTGGGVEDTEAGVASTLEPLDPVERQVVREAVPAERLVAAVARGATNLVTRLRPGAPTDVVFEPARASAPRVRYELPPSALGATVRVTVGEDPPVEQLVREPRGWITLGRQAGGARRVRVDGPADGLYTIDRIAATPRAGELFAERVVWALDRAAPVRVRVSKSPRERVTVVAVVYGPADVVGSLRLVVGGGHPARRQDAFVTGLTRAERTIVVPPPLRAEAAMFRDRAGDAGQPRAVGVALREDLAGGTHEVGVYSRAGKPLWVRFYVRREQPHEAETLIWRRTLDEDAP